MEQILDSINQNKSFLHLLDYIRGYLSSSKSKEQLNTRLRWLYLVLSPFFLRNGPRRKQDQDVLSRLHFFLSEIESPQSVIDVGCFDGYFSEKLREYGCKVVGVDSLDLILKRTRIDDPKGDYKLAFSEDLPFPDNCFDVGIYSHLLEHVFDPDLTLFEARRVIKPKGKLIVVIPYGVGTDANHLREFDQKDLLKLVCRYFSNIQYYSTIGTGHGCTAINLK